MTNRPFDADLKLYGPEAAPPKRVSFRKARRYCRRLARRHYENFTVVSRLFPAPLRQHLCNVYAYCRWADDLADESGSAPRALAMLDWWEGRLRECYHGRSIHPVFVALDETIRQFAVPIDPFVDLLVAFRQDQRQTRYETFDQLLVYCRYSANPVGRLVLRLAGCHDPKCAIRADSVCTGLQLTNFLQDVALDWDRGRVYLPQTHLQSFGYDESMFSQRLCNEAFRRLMAAEAGEAEGFLRRGLPLVAMVPEELKLNVTLFIHGGLAILQKIREVDYDVWTRRPVLSTLEKLRLVVRCWWQLRHPPPPEGPHELPA
jgi:squalene synthase HpnC